jgi:hypothetical protein
MVAAGHSTSLALETNSISLDPSLNDAWGVPAIRVTYKDHPDDLATGRFMRDRAAEIMPAAGAQSPGTNRSSSANACGSHFSGCRRNPSRLAALCGNEAALRRRD